VANKDRTPDRTLSERDNRADKDSKDKPSTEDLSSVAAGAERSKETQKRDTQAGRNAAADEFDGGADDAKRLDPDEEGITVVERERRLSAQGKQAQGNPLGNP
jgi:hypothetical protein